MDWKAVAEKIIHDDEQKWDRRVSAPQIRVYDNGKLVLLEDDGAKVSSYALSELAEGQMCHKLEIPVKYYRRLPGEMKAVVANHDIGRLNGNSYLLRGKGNPSRACIVSEIFRLAELITK